MNIPNHTATIFDILSRGHFICSNSPDDTIRRLYDIVEEHFELLHTYFNGINFILERGDEFFYFSRREAKADLERKLKFAFKWIDIVDFFKTFNNSFTSGFRFTPSDILVQLNLNADLKAKLGNLKKYSKQDNYEESIRKIIDMLCKDNFIQLELELTSSYKVLASFKYLEELILSINISEDSLHEIPE